MGRIFEAIKAAFVKAIPPEPPGLHIIPTGIQAQYDAGTRSKVRAIQSIVELVVHGTAGGQSAAAVINWMQNGELAASYRKGEALFHYLIGRDGQIFQIVEPSRWCYHSSSGIHDKKTVGVELVNPTGTNAGAYTNEQYFALADLVDHLKKIGCPIRLAVGHGRNQLRYSPSYGYKQCPGAGFSWPRFADMVGGTLGKEEVFL